MTATEWLLSKGFRLSDMPDEKLGFEAIPGYVASVEFFEAVFYPAIAQAEQAGQSSYQAVMSVPGGTRGWELYFEDWKRRGILT